MNLVFGLPEPVVFATAGVWALLVIASLIVWGLRLRGPADRYHELVQRTESWWWMIGAFTFAIAVNQTVAIVFLAFISYLALKEYLSLIPTRRIDRGLLLFAYLAIPIQYYWAAIDWYGMFIVFVPVWLFLFFPALMALRGDTQGFLRAVGTLSWGLMLTVFALSHLAMLLVSGEVDNPVAGGVGLLFFVVVLTQFNDVAQYTWGKLIGRHKVTPKVSPKKTWEGLDRRGAHHDRGRRLPRPLPHPHGRGVVGARRCGDRRRRVPRRHHHLGGEARSRRQGHGWPDPRPWRHPRPRGQPHLRGARVLPLLPLFLHAMRRTP